MRAKVLGYDLPLAGYVYQDRRASTTTGTGLAVYHALPWGLCGPLGEPIRARQYVDIKRTVALKREALACHVTQKAWLDQTQGLDSYLTTMEDMARSVGAMSGVFEVAEGWRRHLHLGFGPPDFDPLSEALGDKVHNLPEED